MHKVKEIKLHRAEGAHHEIRTEHLGSFADAEHVLWLWAHTAPDDGSYHKCDVHIWWEDGSSYYTRYDLVSDQGEGNPPLAEYVQDQLAHAAKHSEQPKCSRDAWKESMRAGAGRHPGYRELLKNYAFD